MILSMKTTPLLPPTESVAQSHSLMAHIGMITDPRINRRRRHELLDILVIAICTLLCGGESFYDMEDFGYAKEEWFHTFLSLPNGIPSHDTFNRVFAALDPNAFWACFLKWTESLRRVVDEEIVAMDGKALRRAAKDGSIPYIVSAWAVRNGLVLGQLRVPDKTNEITAVPELLRALELAGCIVTVDAMDNSKRAGPGRVINWVGLPTSRAGRDYKVSVWLNPCAKSRVSSNRNGATS